MNISRTVIRYHIRLIQLDEQTVKLTNNDPMIVALKLADQWSSDGSGSQGWQIKSALWRQTCDAYERSQAAVSFGLFCPS